MRYEVVAAGECLFDVTSTEYADELSPDLNYRARLGGSPCNLAMNLVSLGAKTALVACVGREAFGRQAQRELTDWGVGMDGFSQSERHATSLVLVSRSRSTPDFEVYRAADPHLSWSAFASVFADTPRIFHTTCFALSRLPARSHLLRAAEYCAQAGSQLSLDANYSAKVWADRRRAQAVVRQFAVHGALIKLSADDVERLYGRQVRYGGVLAHELSDLLRAGALELVLTHGADGAEVWARDGSVTRMKASAVDVVDATGAGDSFWAGYLAAWLAGANTAARLRTASRTAAIKLTLHGPLPPGSRARVFEGGADAA